MKIKKHLYVKYGLITFKDVMRMLFGVKKYFYLEPFIYINGWGKPCETHEMSSVVRWLDKKTVSEYSEVRAMRYWNNILTEKYKLQNSAIYYF